MSILVIAEHDNATLSAHTCKVLGAASELNARVHLLVMGQGCAGVAEQGRCLAGVSKVLLADDTLYQHQLAEPCAALVSRLATQYRHVLAPASTFGKDMLPRAAALLGVGMVADVVAIESEDTFVRPVYAGNALARVQSLDPVTLLTVRPTAFDAVGKDEAQADIEPVAAVTVDNCSRFVGDELRVSERPELTSARVVVSGGRGLGSKEQFALLETLADKLGAAVGASRAAVDAGLAENDQQVGQTGKIVAPELYIAVGISGAIQHLAGIKDARIIVAINKDEDAPIFEVADYGLVADLFEVLPELEKML
ncbi:electron transfer flavoprotein subunit alpha/FixB family protein [Oceanimonas baumannii]|uniref:Electron transfer flavoprotein subunit alpha n=1 Tax=Oceanimonas baumannii TaxID=129578 RepID=A0A235CLK8_9GAMM|nr:FAD-binding protein [Oceanimonas baumannii]OYD25453.1 electron transfer flavoprotein subunit alpha [Oceanimonas baumannii]TDW61349.1 electron transfer flavoprotein alpha subunit apoprotein [Oceanimonas baumannii]